MLLATEITATSSRLHPQMRFVSTEAIAMYLSRETTEI